MNNPTQHESWILGIRGQVAGTALALAIMFVAAVLATGSAQAQTYTFSVLYTFTGSSDGANPYVETLVLDSQGNLYGTTAFGGDLACNGGGGCGVVFKLDATGKETVLHSFTGTPDGANPYTGVVRDAQGNLYGTTSGGGAYGTVFKLDTTGKETVLYSFCSQLGCIDGANPSAGLVQDTQGNLYGTTRGGGAYGNGTVFKLDTTLKETVLYSFTGTAGDGADPFFAGLVQDAQGTLYGTTFGGGDLACPNTGFCGTVFKVDTTGKETVLHSFTGTPDGALPYGGFLVQDAQGNLYGTTSAGGAFGGGTVFKVDTTGKETVLYSFGSTAEDGYGPQAGLVRDAQGNLYGTTYHGAGGACYLSCGAVFKVDTTGKETVLYSFTGTPDGGFPFGGLVLDGQGNLYGTTYQYGTYGYGTVFKLTPPAATTTTTALTSSLNPSAYGQAVTFTAAVTSSAGAPPNGETVTFMNGTTVLGTGALSGGSASFTISTLPVGINAITAVYSGDTNFLTSTGTLSGGQIVTSASAGIGVASSQNPSVFGQSVTFTATISGEYGLVKGRSGALIKGRSRALIKGGVQPQDVSGTVAWSTNTGCGTTSVTSGNPGTATCTTSILAVGTDTITATYSGDSNHSGGTGTLSGGQTVNQASTTLALTSSVNPSGLGQPVTFTAAITPQYSGQASGTVTFKDGATTLGSTAVSGNAASLTTSGLAMGTHSISAGYSGDSNFTGSTSNTLSQVVTTVKTTTTLVSSRNPSVSGKPVTFTALVSSSAGTPTGKIEFLNGATVLATVTLKSGAAKYTTSQLPPGSNTITAFYSGDSNHSGSTSPAVNQVVQAPTTTTLTSSPNPSAYGQAVILTATVTATSGAPPDGEAVTFKQGSTLLGKGTLSGGTATLSTSTLGVGEKKVTAVYGGDANFTSSKSEILSQVVGEAATTTTLVSSLNPSTYKQAVTFTASVTPQFSSTVTGKVTFYDGTTLLKTVALSGGVAEFTTSKLTSGTHSITATYNGSTDFTGSSSAPLTQTVN